MNNQMEKPMLYYFHQNEIVRIMRVRLLDSIDPQVDLSPNYSNDLKIGVVIGTCGATPYIDLQLHYLKNINKIDKILVHDDCSSEKEQLKELCNQYNVDFYSTPKNLFHKACVGSIGDQSCFYEGLLWAKRNNIDILVKLSRRLIPCYKWIDDFKKLILESNGLTFSSFCTKDPFPIRTECIGMNVNAWTNNYTMNHLKSSIDNEFPLFAEYWFDAMAKQIDDQNFSENHSQLYSGYVHWYDLLGTCRFNTSNRHENVLWHQYSTENDYLKKLNEIFKDKYIISDLNKLIEI